MMLLSQAALVISFSALLSSSHALAPVDANSASVTAILSKTYDFIVVGGGNTGLALAARLSEDSSKTVLVLEAGPLDESNSGIAIPALAGSTFQSSIDWNFNTVPQENAGSRSVYWPRGKVLGGSSALNFMAVTRGPSEDYDAWSSLGNPGWDWDSLLPYFKKSEKFFAPTGNSENETIAFTDSVHGKTGPVSVSYPPFISPQFTGVFDALRSRGIPVAKDLSRGNAFGVSWAPSSINPATHTRETSHTAYIAPNVARANLIIITNAQVTRINWKAATSASAPVVASGVSFVASGATGTVLKATAKSEVILSAGSIQSPQLLELSGIGNPAILKPLGILTIVDLKAVGENLQDHPAVVVVYKLKPGVTSLENLSTDPAFYNAALAAYGAGKGILTQALYALAYLTGPSFLSVVDQTKALCLMATPYTGISVRQLLKQVGLYLGGSPIVELLSINVYFGSSAATAGSSYLSIASCLQHSFSRGSIHIKSSNPLTYPAIDPQYLQHPVDKFFLSKSAQYIRTLGKTSALAAYVDVETEPGLAVSSQAQWDTWIEDNVRTEYHPIATASMLPREDGGVVSPQLIVYGTSNVRVVDLSIVPLHVGSHVQTAAYVIAEKAAAMIKAKY